MSRWRTVVRRTRLPLLVAAAVFFFGPALMGAAGLRATPIENRALAPRPSLSQGWGFFPAAAAYATDHLPFRAWAVHTNGRVSNDVFGQPVVQGSTTVHGISYPNVIVGKDNYLYYGQDFQLPCTAREPVSATVARLNRLDALLRAAGKDVVITVAPDKSSILPQYLPRYVVGRQCAEQRKAAFWSAFGDVHDGIDVRRSIAAIPAAQAGPYLHANSHWTPAGEVTYARDIVQAVQPGLWDPSAVVSQGTIYRPGDLGQFLAETRGDHVPGYTVERPGVTPTWTSLAAEDSHPQELKPDVAAGVPVVQGKSLLMGDSFSYHSRPDLAPYFADLTVAHGTHTPPGVLLDLLVSSHTVVLEQVEREATQGYLGQVTDAFLDQLQQRLQAS